MNAPQTHLSQSPVYVVIFLSNMWTEARSRNVTLTIKVSQFVYYPIHLIE